MTDVHIPKMGMSTVEVDILQVLVSVGQRVSAGEVLFEVEGEKASFEVEAPVDGTVSAVLVAVGEVREVGELAIQLG